MKRKIYTITGAIVLSALGLYVSNNTEKIYTPRNISEAGEQEEMSEYMLEHGIKGAIDEIYSMKANQITGTIDSRDIIAAREATNKASLRRVGKKLVWQDLGPDNVGGRTRSILIDRNDPNIMYMGAVSGGLFKSTTRGTSWNPVGDQTTNNLNVVSLTQAANGDIYYGTGEDGFLISISTSGTKDGTPGFQGNGVYKSTDGVNFTHLASTPGAGIWENVHRLASDPTNSNIIYAANDGGFHYSENGGTSWTKTPGVLGTCLEVKVSNGGVVFAAIGTSIYKSTDKGKTLTKTGFNVAATSPIVSVGRVTIAISPQDENYIYALVSNTSSALAGLYRSTNGGGNWEMLVSGAAEINNVFSAAAGSQSQGYFDNVVTVDPLNKNRAILGGVRLAEWSSTKGYNFIGSTFAARTNDNYVHSDKHEFVWDNSVNPPILFIGTDGGLFRCANMYAKDFNYVFSQQNRGFSTTQYFGLAAAADGTVMGGTQDNSNQLINGKGNTPKSAVELFSGDGFQTEISKQNSNILFLESQYGNLAKSSNGGVGFSNMWDNRIGDGSGSVTTGISFAPFDCMFRLWEHPSDSSKSKFFFAPYNTLWAAIGPLSTTDNPTWFPVSFQGGGANANARVTHLAPSLNGDNLFYSTRGGGLFRVDSINSASFDTALYPRATAKTTIPTPIVTRNIKGNLPAGRAITSINIDPSNPNRAIVTMGNYGNGTYVFISNNILDASPTYTDVTNNLPKMPVYEGIILIDNPNYFIVATEFGIWASDDNGTTWENQSNGMPNVASYIIRQYEFKPWEGPRIYVATHGRGFFKSNTFLTSVEKVTAKIANTSVSIFPNPTSDQLNVSFDAANEGLVTFVIYNLQGQQMNKIVEKVNAGTIRKQFDVSHLAKGTYIMSVGDGANKKAVKFLVN